MSKPPVNIAVPPPVQQQQAQQQQQLQQKKNPQKNQHPNQNQQSQESGEWTDEKLVDALKRLDDLHSKLISLRTVIPRLTLPLSTSHPSPAELYEDLSTRARGASEEVLAFNKLFVDSAGVFEHANQSRVKNPQGIQAVSVYDMFYPDDGEEEEAIEEAKKKDEDTEMKEGDEEEVEEEEVVEDTKEEDVDGLLEAFKGNDAGLKIDIEVKDSGRTVKITLPSPADLLFTIDIPSSSPTHDITDPSSAARRFIVSSVTNAKKPEQATPHLYTSILRSITTRPNAGNLQLLLEMLTTYITIYSAPCKKCGKMTAGSKVELPVVRNRDTILVEIDESIGGISTGAGGKKKGKKKEKVWAPYHEVCM
ncbi:hypothetical protein DFP73DRAFT_22319 [Morchella snyderi]|nr:hypothetical protein DFP73DRAFT_22319 [Morchella snyderi]